VNHAILVGSRAIKSCVSFGNPNRADPKGMTIPRRLLHQRLPAHGDTKQKSDPAKEGIPPS